MWLDSLQLYQNRTIVECKSSIFCNFSITADNQNRTIVECKYKPCRLISGINYHQNRTIVECKSNYQFSFELQGNNQNRTIVECKSKSSILSTTYSCIRIEPQWNVNYFFTLTPAGLPYQNRTIVECKCGRIATPTE